MSEEIVDMTVKVKVKISVMYIKKCVCKPTNTCYHWKKGYFSDVRGEFDKAL